MKKFVLFALLFGISLITAPVAFSQAVIPPEFEVPADARPENGQGSVFVDFATGSTFLVFSYYDLTGDYLTAGWFSNVSDFAREMPSGRQYLHTMEERASMIAVVDGLQYNSFSPVFGGTLGGFFQQAYTGNCPVFEPEVPAFTCFIGAGPASMNARATAIRLIDGAECTISAHLAAFYQDNPVSQGFFVANERQFDIKVDCP
jgi:hypothetical protein